MATELACKPAPRAEVTDYVCPDTHQSLKRTEQSLLSPGGRRFPILDGVANFNRHPPAESTRTTAELATLNDVARTEGWFEALRCVHGSSPEMTRYVTDSSRARFLDLLPLTPTSRVLEIGPGLGQFTPLLAARSGWVHALEVVEGQAAFVAERCRQEGAENVTVACGGDDCRVPFADGTFDVVVLNLVLEWCGAREGDTDSEAAQRRLLGEIRRVLEPGGVLFVATKNRFSLRYLLGGRDEHLHGIRFGSALPRWLGRLTLSVKGHPRAPGRLHSWGRLRRMLRESGLEPRQSFWAAPEMRYPVRMIDTRSTAIRAARREGGFKQGETRWTSLLMKALPARLVRYVTPGLAFLAQRPADGAR